MIVIFGDHWPQLEDGFFEQLLGKKKSSLETIESQITYTTPYIIWTNYPSETKEEDISCNYLGSSMLEKAGVQLTEYEQFLANLKEELPIIGVGAVCDKDGNWYTMDDLPEKYQTLLNEYQILQYITSLRKNRSERVLLQLSEVKSLLTSPDISNRINIKYAEVFWHK